MGSQSLPPGILLTGASSDIGGAVADLLHRRQDRRALLVSRRPAVVPANAYSGCQYLPGIDLTDEAALARLTQEAADFFVEPFVVLHCVGDFWKHRPLVRTPLREVRSMIESHYLTLCGVASSTIPLMMKLGGGHLVAFSCNSVAHSYPDMAPFTAAKAAIESFIRCLANEYSEFGIAATALALPTVSTAKVLDEKSSGDIPNYVTPHEVAAFVLDNVAAMPSTVTGNVLKMFKFSPTFYNSGYFQRNPRATGMRELTVVELPSGK